MTEYIYNELWEFAKQHKDYKSPVPNQPQSVAILNLYQEESNHALNLQSAADIEECTLCIRMALMYAF